MARIPKAIQRAVEELRTLPDESPAAARRGVAEMLCRLGEADAGAWYTLGSIEGAPRPVRWWTTGSETLVPRLERALEGLRDHPVPWGTGDPRRPPRRWTRTFLAGDALADRETYERTRFSREVLQPAGIEDRLRLVVYRGDRFVGWVGALRSSGATPFTQELASKLSPLVKPVAAAVTAADATEQAGRAAEGADIVARPDGTIEYRSRNVRAWMSTADFEDAVRHFVRSVDSGQGEQLGTIAGVPVEWTRLEGEGAVRYLLHLHEPATVRIAPDAILSPTQRRVAELASEGVTSREAGRILGIGVESVRSHLQEIYRRLDVSSRTELTRALSSAS